MRARWATSLLAPALTIPLLLVGIRTPVGGYDEGFALTWADRVRAGAVPYRDFWSPYPFGQTYALAGVMEAFGDSLLTTRLFDTAVRFGIVLVVHQLARRLAGGWLAVAATAAVAVLLAGAGFYSYSAFPALLAGLVALWCWTVSAEGGSRRWGVAAGVALGVTAVFRWDFGLHAAAAVAASSAVPVAGPRLRGWAMALARSLALPAGVAVAIAGTSYGIVAARSGPRVLVDQVFRFTVVDLPGERRLSYPALLSPSLDLDGRWLSFYAPLLVLVGVAWSLRRTAVGGSDRLEPVDRLLVGVVVLGAGLFVQALSRFDAPHVLPSAVLAVLAAAGLVRRSWSTPGPARWGAAAAFALVAAVQVAAGWGPLRHALEVHGPLSCHSSAPRAACAAVPADQAAAVELTRASTAPGEAIYVGNDRHDQVLAGDSAFYFLADRPPATRYEALHPGVVDTMEVQQEMIADLERRAVRWVVLVTFPDSREPNGSSTSSGVRLLDEYLAANFREVAVEGRYRLLTRGG